MGIIPHVAASILGLSVVLHMSAAVFHGLKWAGAIYLLYLAWAIWREQGALTLDAAASNMRPWQIITKAIFLNILNPKLTIFFFAFLPLFIAPNTASPTADLFILSAVFMALTLIVVVVYGALASGIRTYVINSPRFLVWLRRSFAATFVALAVHLAVTDQ